MFSKWVFLKNYFFVFDEFVQATLLLCLSWESCDLFEHVTFLGSPDCDVFCTKLGDCCG